MLAVLNQLIRYPCYYRRPGGTTPEVRVAMSCPVALHTRMLQAKCLLWAASRVHLASVCNTRPLVRLDCTQICRWHTSNGFFVTFRPSGRCSVIEAPQEQWNDGYVNLVTELAYQATTDSTRHGCSRDSLDVRSATLDNRLGRIWMGLGRGKERTVGSSRFHDDNFQAACGSSSTCVFDCDVQRAARMSNRACDRCVLHTARGTDLLG